MTDPSRFQAHWKTPFLFNPRDNTSNTSDIQQGTDTSLSARSLPSSPHHHHLRQTNSCAAFQPFDPFDVDCALDDSATITNKDAELDKLSALLSKQFLEDVDAETIPSSSSPTVTTTKTTSSTMSTPNTRMIGSFTNTISSPWAIDDGASFKQPWSPVLGSSGMLPSPNITTKDNNRMDNVSVTSTQWDRFEPYGNDSEFDPTLPFYQGENGHPTPIITHHSPGTTSSNHNNSSTFTTSVTSSVEHENQQQEENPNMTTVALQKLSLLFPDLDEKELGQTLAALGYDLERTIEALPAKSSSTTTTITAQSNMPSPVSVSATSISKASTTATAATAEKVRLIRSPGILTPNSISINNTNNDSLPILPTGTVRKRQVCRHYLAGECYRKDCWFAHDLEVKPCKFWLQGLCLKGDTCEFAHSLEELEQVAKNHHHHPPSPLSSNNIKSMPTSNSHHHQQQHYHQEQQQRPEQHQQQQQYTSPTVADFPILLARSKRKSKKKSQNKKIKT